MKITSFLVLGLTLCFHIHLSSQNTCNSVSDSLELVKFFNNTSGTTWTNRWNLTKPMKSWYGVTLNSGGCVEKIDLSNNNVKGIIPHIYLPNLKNLDLMGNSIAGDLPHLDSLPALRFLNLSQNQMTGYLDEVENLKNLIDLRLNNNQFVGTIPSFTGINSIQNIYLQSNKLSGSLPDFSHFERFFNLNVSNNNLSGELPSFESLIYMVSLFINNNQFTGAVPFFAPNNSLNRMEAQNNKLTGPLSTFRYFGNLEKLDLSNNNIGGNIIEFSNMPNLKILDLSNNKITGSIISLSRFSDIQMIDLSYNSLTGDVPRTSGLSSLVELDLSFNKLSGTINPWISVPSLRTMNFSNNKITKCELTAAELPNLDNLFLENNALTFEDLVGLPRSSFEIFTYAPQADIVLEDSVSLLLGGLFRVDLNIDQNLSTNNYNWYKNNNLLGSNKGNNFLIVGNLDPTDEGVYYCQVSNPNWPELNIKTTPIKLNVICEPYTEDINTTLCVGDSILARGQWRYKDFAIYDTVFAQDGFSCDSIFNVQVEFLVPLQTNIRTFLCDGDTYEFMDIVYREPGVYDISVDSAGYCAYKTRLIIEEAPRYLNNFQYLKCPDEILNIGNLEIKDPGRYIEDYTTIHGCDSTVNYYVSLKRTVEIDSTINFCGETYTFLDQEYQDQDTLNYVDSTVANCKLNYHFLFNQINPIDTAYLDTIACLGDSVVIDGKVLFTEGTYLTDIDYGETCGQIRSTKLELVKHDTTNIYTTFCVSQPFTFEGFLYYGDTSFTRLYHDGRGCDSLVTFNYVGQQAEETYIQDTICFGETLTIGDNSYTETGIYRDTVRTVQGCDELTTVNLFVSHIAIKDTIITYDEQSAQGSIKVSFKDGIPPYKYLWSTGDTTQNLVNVGTNLYTLTVTDKLNCSEDFEFTVGPYVDVNNNYKGIIDVFPTILTSPGLITWSETSELRFTSATLFDVTGRSVESFQLSYSANSLEIGENIRSGMYMLILSTKEGLKQYAKIQIY